MTRGRIDNADRLSGAAFREFVRSFTTLLVHRHRASYDLGRKLQTVKRERLWDKWPRTDITRTRGGYRDWAEFCDKVMAYSDRSVDVLILNYERLSDLELDENEDTFIRALRLGWAKLAVVLMVARNETHLVEWLNYIDSHDRSIIQLRADIEMARARARGEDTEAGDEGDEADEGEEGDETTTGDDPEEAGVAFMCRLPDARAMATVSNAIETVRRRLGENIGQGRAIAMMATYYLGHAPRIDEGGPVIALEEVIQSIEENYRVTLQIVPQNQRRRRRRRRTTRG